MGDTYSTIEIRSTLRTFQEYLRDLIGAKFDQFNTKLRLFVNFCEKDDTFRVIARNLHTQVGDVRGWFFEAVATGGKPKELPKDPLSKLAHMYKTLQEIKAQRIEIRNFMSTLFTGHSIEESHQKFTAGWLEQMQAIFQRLFDAIESELEGKERVELESLVTASLQKLQASAAPAPAKAEPAPAKAAAPAPAKAEAKPAPEAKPAKKAKAGKEPGLDKLVKDLEKAVKGAKEVATKAKADIEADVKMLKLEIGKAAPNLMVVQAIAEPLEKVGGKIAELGAKIASKAKQLK